MELNEKLIFNNCFGTVTDRRVILNYKSGTENLPIGQISSVSYIHERNYLISFLSFFICIVGLAELLTNIDNISGVEAIISLPFIIVVILSGIANWIGHHNIQISVSGKNRKPLKVEMAKTREGREFVDAVNRAVIK